MIFANHYLIEKAQGLPVIPEKNVPEFKRLLVGYYEDRDEGGDRRLYERPLSETDGDLKKLRWNFYDMKKAIAFRFGSNCFFRLRRAVNLLSGRRE